MSHLNFFYGKVCNGSSPFLTQSGNFPVQHLPLYLNLPIGFHETAPPRLYCHYYLPERSSLNVALQGLTLYMYIFCTPFRHHPHRHIPPVSLFGKDETTYCCWVPLNQLCCISSPFYLTGSGDNNMMLCVFCCRWTVNDHKDERIEGKKLEKKRKRQSVIIYQKMKTKIPLSVLFCTGEWFHKADPIEWGNQRALWFLSLNMYK